MEQIPLNPNNNISHNFNYALSLKDFDLIEKLGSGAHASVFKAKHKQTGKIYALKEIKQSDLDRKDKEIDFIRETSILYDLSKQNCPYINKLYADFQDENYKFLVLEYFEGKTLEQLQSNYFSQNKYIPENLVIHILTKLLEALKYLHDTCKIINRNIKPDNIMIDRDNNIKIINFCLAAYLENQNDILVSKKSFKGPVRFVAPEILLSNPRNYDYKIDIFSLGFTIYSIMNPSKSNLCNLPCITEKKNGVFSRIDTNINNTFYSKRLIEFVKSLYENDQNKRPTASEALNILKNILNELQINNNEEEEYLFKENIGISSMKMLLQIFNKMDQMQNIKTQLNSLFSSCLLNYKDFFIYSFNDIFDTINKFENGYINQINYTYLINEFIRKTYINSTGIIGTDPIHFYYMMVSIFKNECKKYFHNIIQNKIFDEIINNNYSDFSNLVPMNNPNAYNQIVQLILDFKNNYKGPLIDNFFFLILTVSKCPSCDNFYEMKNKISSFILIDSKIPKNNISQLINDYFSPKIGSENFNCNYCGVENKCLKRLYCLNLPNYLVLGFKDKNIINFDENIILPLYNGKMSLYHYYAGIYKSANNANSDYSAVIKNGNHYLLYSNDKVEECNENYINLHYPYLVIYKKN